MLTRRTFCGCVLGSLTLPLAGQTAQASDCAVVTREFQQSITPQEVLASLKEGNERFLAGHTAHCDLLKQVFGTADQQAPTAAIVGCIDSRVPPELIFDQRIGEVFSARVAGNFVNVDILGSLEYATKVAGAKVIVVLGHSGCGAIKSVVDQVELGNITALLANLQPALDDMQAKYPGKHSSKDHEFVQAVADQNVRLTATNMISRSPIIADLVKAGQLVIAPAMHDVTTGRVSWL